MNDPSFDIRPIVTDDYPWVTTTLSARWGSTKIISRGQVHQADQLPGFILWYREEPVGLTTYHIDGIDCEIITIDSLIEGAGIGTTLIDAVKEIAKVAGCTRLWGITTNDNTSALAFYQQRGFQLAALHKDAISKSRNHKPEIPKYGQSGIPIRDEIEFEMWL